MRFYLYISDTKLDMLFAQIPMGIRDKLVGELKVDLKLVSLSLRENPSDETRYSKLKVVTEFLENEGVSGIDDPSAYFGGELEMDWRPLTFGAVYFTGETEKTFVGLGGSAQHVIGVGPSSDDPQWPPSLALSLIPLLAQEDRPEVEGREDPEARFWAWTVSQLACDARHAPTRQRVEFCARRLVYEPAGPIENKAVLLGSPIYVAAAD